MSWDKQRRSKEERLNAAAALCNGKTVATENIVKLMEAVIHPGDKVVLEGDNQKQAAFLAASLAEVDPKVVHDLTMIIPSISRSEHLDYFEKGIASTVDFAFAGTQAQRLSEMLAEGKVKIGNFNTYLEIYARLFVDLIPNVCLVAADKADKDGNLFTGYSTEETPTLVEAAACKSGIVIAQVNEIVEDLPRVDIPGGWVDFIVPADKPYPMEPLFTRDPQFIKDADILMGMMVIKGIYAKHGVQSLNHGIGFNGAAIELLLPTYGEQLGLKGKICRNWVLNPHPTLIPAIEAGWVESICAFGGEVGMEKYTEERSDIFFTGADGTLRSNRTLAQVAGLYAIDSFLGATLQMDYYGNSSTVTAGRLSGFGGAPNMGHNPGGRRHSSPAYHSLVEGKDTLHGGQKIVIQMLKSSGKKGNNFVPELDAIARDGRVRLMLECRMFMGSLCCNQLDLGGMEAHYQAAERMARALGREDDLRSMAYNRAASQVECGRYQEAYGYFAALEHPRVMELHKLAVCCEGLGRTREALDALDRAETAPEEYPDRALCMQLCAVVKMRLRNPDYLRDPAYGQALLAAFDRCRRELPIGYAAFHLPRVLEWLTAGRQYKQAYELLRDFPIKLPNLPV